MMRATQIHETVQDIFPDKEMQEKADRIAKAARKSLSRYCYEECSAYCCRKGYLLLREVEADLVLQGKKEELLAKGIVKKLEDGRYSLNMGKVNMPCPSLDQKELKCSIHKKRNRPKACKEFPLFFKDDWLLVSSRCPAVKLGMLYPYTHKLVKLGYRLYREHLELEF